MRRFLAAILLAAPLSAHAGPIECASTQGVEAEAGRQINRLNLYDVAGADPVVLQRGRASTAVLIAAVLRVHDYVRLGCPPALEPKPETISFLYMLVGGLASQLNADGVPDAPRGTLY